MILNLYKHIDRSKIQFDFVIFHDEERMLEEEIKNLGGKVFYIEAFNGKNLFRFVNAWKDLLKNHPEYRIVHGHVRSVAAIYLLIAKKIGRVTIAHSHSISNGKGVKSAVKNVMQFPIRYVADYLFACSDEAGRWLYGKKACAGEKYHFFPNAIDITRYQYDETIRAEMRKKLDIEEKLVIGTVGRISEPKNPYGILDIFEKVSKKNEKAVLVWVGGGELEADIKKEAARRKLTDRIRFMGNRKDVPELMQTFDIFIFPSLWEGLPVTVIEAQAAGLPCLISDRVTKQVAVSKLVHYLPVDQGYEVWEEAILNSNLDRQDVQNEIRQAGFDIHDSAKWISDFYVRMLRED